MARSEPIVPNAAVPAGFVFHCYQCGSTPLARILAQDPEALVVSEAGAVNNVLFPHFVYPEEEPLPPAMAGLLRTVIPGLGRRRGLAHRRFYPRTGSSRSSSRATC